MYACTGTLWTFLLIPPVHLFPLPHTRVHAEDEANNDDVVEVPDETAKEKLIADVAQQVKAKLTTEMLDAVGPLSKPSKVRHFELYTVSFKHIDMHFRPNEDHNDWRGAKNIQKRIAEALTPNC